MKMCPTEDLAHMYVDDLSVSSVGDTMTAVTVIVKRKLVIVVSLKIAVPEENILPNVVGFKGPFSRLNNARYGISWGALGAAEFCVNQARDYTMGR